MSIILAAKLLDIPIVYHLRVVPLEEHGEFLKNSDAIIAVSEFIKEEASRKNLDADKIKVVVNGIDLQHFSRAHFNKTHLRKESNLPQDARIVLNIARFAPNKRHDLLITASEIVAKTLPDFHLVLVGEARDKRHYQAIIGFDHRFGQRTEKCETEK